MIKEMSVKELRELSLAEIKLRYSKLTAVYAKRLAMRFKEDAEAAEIAYGERLSAKKMEKAYLTDEENEKERYIDAYQRLQQAYSEISTKKGFAKIKTTMPALINLESSRVQTQVEDILGNRHVVTHEDFYNWSDEVLIEHPETDRNTLSILLKNNDGNTRAVMEELYNRLKVGSR